MEKTKKEKLAKILSNAKHYKINETQNSFSTSASFGFEVIEKNNDIENSILFNSLSEAVEIVSKFAQQNTEEEVKTNLKNLILAKNINFSDEFRLKVITS